MTVFGVKRWYLVFIGLPYAIGLGATVLFNLNLFAEIGTVIVVASIWRAYRGLIKLNWSAPTFSGLATQAQTMVLKWDAIAVAIGTVTNGFAIWIFEIMKLVSCALTQLWPTGWATPVTIACCGN